MGEQSNKYHIDNDGHVFRVNVDGSFTDIGNISDSPKYNPSRLAQIEQYLINDNLTHLSMDDVKLCCLYSQNTEALLAASSYNDDALFYLLVKRFEGGATFLENVLNGAQYDSNEKTKLALAKCKRPFSDEGILRTLAKDKNPKISYAAKSNPHYKKGGGCGCFSVIIIAFVVGASYYLF